MLREKVMTDAEALAEGLPRSHVMSKKEYGKMIRLTKVRLSLRLALSLSLSLSPSLSPSLPILPVCPQLTQGDPTRLTKTDGGHYRGAD